MDERVKAVLSINLMFIRGGSYLLLRRAGDWAKGQWALVAGHVEQREAPSRAAIREALEEIGALSRQTCLGMLAACIGLGFMMTTQE